MAGLSEGDFRAALEFVRECDLAGDLEAYRATVLQVVEHVPGNIVSYNEIDLAGQKAVTQLDPPELITAEALAQFGRYAHQHPVISYLNETGDLAPYAISDFLAEEDFHGLDLYRSFYRDFEVEDQIAFGLPSPRELVLGVAINRDRRGFSERDRAFLALVAPHAGRAYVVARARSRVREALEAEDLRPSPSSALLVLGRKGAVEAFSPDTESLLDDYFGVGISAGGELPERLAEHVARIRGERSLAASPPPSELLVERDSRRLRVCFVEGATDGEPDVVMLDSEADPLAPARMRLLGLTAREAEVVKMVADGRTNAEIAAAIGVSPRTVQRHLENVYDKLEVRTRAGVVGRLLRA